MMEFGAVSDMLLAISAVIIAASVSWGVTRLLSIQRRSDSNLDPINDRSFHAEYGKYRGELESQIARLSHELINTRKEFSEVNHLLLETNRAQGNLGPRIQDSASWDFKKSLGISDGEVDPRLVFVLTPFHVRERATYAAIVQAFQGVNAIVKRGDEESHQNILAHIVQQISKARLVIANVSTRNPNVMYELGIAHALGKPVILISKGDETNLPFDLRNQTTIFFNDRSDLIRKLQHHIAKQFFSATNSYPPLRSST